MEGESLLNDATAISLFQVFFVMVKDLHPSKLGTDEPLSILEQLGSVAGQIVWLAVGEPCCCCIWPACPWHYEIL